MTSHASTLEAIRETWPLIVANARRQGFRFNASQVPFPAVPRLLGSSHKVELGEGLGVLTAVIYMSPALESGYDMCAFRAGSGCEKSCIGTSTGFLLSRPAAKLSRLWKTALWLGSRGQWRTMLANEARAHARKARRRGLVPAIRIDGSSDTGEGGLMSEIVREVRWYDYTKSTRRALVSLVGGSWHVTLSYHGSNQASCGQVLSQGGNVAVVFNAAKGEPLPKYWNGYPVIDGDVSDARFLDPPGHVVGLRFKRASKKAEFAKVGMKTGFVLPVLP